MAWEEAEEALVKLSNRPFGLYVLFSNLDLFGLA